MNKSLNNFDIIIIGAGLSGISLLLELIKKTNKKILILERKKKLIKDKNWCFWNYPENIFTKNYDKKWNKIKIKINNNIVLRTCKKFSYLNISSDKLYNFGIKKINETKNTEFLLNQKVEILEEYEEKVIVKSNNKLFTSKLVFDSRPKKIEKNKLLQHFLGVEVSCKKAIFDQDVATLMDFQPNNKAVHFFYILPFSKKKALIETTYFSKKTYSKKKYFDDIKAYINKNFPNIKLEYGFCEQGVIPMYHSRKKNINKRIINIGSSNNWIRSSTGYGFQNAFRNSKKIVDDILLNKKINVRTKKITFLLDEIFLIFIEKFPHYSINFFYSFFSKLKLKTIVRFLTDSHNFLETLKIIMVLPKIKLFISMLYFLKKND